MRTEFGEGLTLEASADEASIEVIAPDRTLMLTRSDGRLLERWGVAIDPSWSPHLGADVLDTLTIGGEEMRVRSQRVQYRDHAYVAVVMAPLRELEAATSALRRTLGLGIFVALGRRRRRRMARRTSDAASAGGHGEAGDGDYREHRLAAPADAQCARRARTARDGFQWPARSADVMPCTRSGNSWRMRRTNCERRCRSCARRPRSRWRATRRSSEDYREMMVIVGEQADRLAHLVNTMFLLSRAEANGLPLDARTDLHRRHRLRVRACAAGAGGRS